MMMMIIGEKVTDRLLVYNVLSDILKFKYSIINIRDKRQKN
jgi:hypothetical protein